MKGTEQHLKGSSPVSVLHETGLWPRKRGPRGGTQESAPCSEAQPGDCPGPRAGPWPSARIPHTVHIRCTPHAPTAPCVHAGQAAGEQADGNWQPPGSPGAQPLTFLASFPHMLKHRLKNPEPQQRVTRQFPAVGEPTPPNRSWVLETTADPRRCHGLGWRLLGEAVLTPGLPLIPQTHLGAPLASVAAASAPGPCPPHGGAGPRRLLG